MAKTQKMKDGIDIPIPKRSDFFSDLKKAAAPEKKSERRGMSDPAASLIDRLRAKMRKLPRYWLTVPNAANSQTQSVFLVDVQRAIDELESEWLSAQAVAAEAPGVSGVAEIYRLAAQDVTPQVCKTCDGRGFVMRYESRDLGNGLGAGGCWNEPCPDCSTPKEKR